MNSGLDKQLETSEKQKFYSDPKTASLLKLIAKQKGRVEPSIGQDGKIHWEIVESELKGKDVDVEALLEHMAKVGIFEKVPFDGFVACPFDNRVDVLARLSCPKCEKTTLEKVSLLSHELCGFIGDASKYYSEGRLICPKCKREIKSQATLKLVGSWFECTNCGARTNSPIVFFECKSGHKFKIPEAVLKNVYIYKMKDDVIKELMLIEALGPSLKQVLVSFGFEVQQPAEITGKSGALHHFDVYAKKGENDLTIEVIINSKPIDSIPVLTYFAKTFDTGTKYPVLIVIPGVKEEVKSLIKTYKISLVSSMDGSDVSQKIKELVSEIEKS